MHAFSLYIFSFESRRGSIHPKVPKSRGLLIQLNHVFLGVLCVLQSLDEGGWGSCRAAVPPWRNEGGWRLNFRTFSVVQRPPCAWIYIGNLGIESSARAVKISSASLMRSLRFWVLCPLISLCFLTETPLHFGRFAPGASRHQCPGKGAG